MTRGKHCDQAVILLADGVRADILQQLLELGELPGIERLFCRNQKPVVETGVSVFPSTTGPAHLPFLTGRYPGGCNIPGIRWFDPQEYARTVFSPYRFRSYMGVGNFFLGRDIHPDVRTAYQQIEDHASVAGNIGKGLRLSRNLTLASKILHNVKSFIAQDWQGLDRVAGEKLLQAVKQKTPFVFSVFYSADSNGHKGGPSAPRTVDSYRLIDEVIGDLGDVLRDQGLEENTLVCLVSDHGMSPTEKHIDLAALFDSHCGPCLAHPRIWHGLLHARSAVMVSGNGMAHVYLKGKNGWGGADDRETGEFSHFVDILLQTEGIDHIAFKCADGSIRVSAREGIALITGREGGRIEYSSQGKDPFGYAGVSGMYDDRELLHITFPSDYPDAPRQLLQIFQSPRCGHLVVTARPGYDLRSRFERPQHLGTHGSLHRDHMLVPIMFNREMRGGARRSVDVYPTVLEALGAGEAGVYDGESLFL